MPVSDCLIFSAKFGKDSTLDDWIRSEKEIPDPGLTRGPEDGLVKYKRCLENDLDAELDVARAKRAGDAPKTPARQVAVYGIQIDTVEHIKELRPEVNLARFAKEGRWDLLQQVHIHIGEAGVGERVTPQVPGPDGLRPWEIRSLERTIYVLLPTIGSLVGSTFAYRLGRLRWTGS